MHPKMGTSLKLLALMVVMLRHCVRCQEATASPRWAPPPDHLQPSRPTSLLRNDSPQSNLHKLPTEVLPLQASGIHPSTTPSPMIPLIPHIVEGGKETQGSHISDFTNPKTGHNPFLDLIEGTSTSTSRIASIVEERQDGRSPPPAPAAPPVSTSQDTKESRWTRPRTPHSSLYPRKNAIKFPTSRTSDYPVEGNTYGRPRITTEPIEGTTGNARVRIPFDQNRGNTRYSYPPPPPVKDDIPVQIDNKPYRGQQIPGGESSDLVPSSANDPSASQIPHFTRSHPKTTPNSRIAVHTSGKSDKDTSKESVVPTVNSKQNIYMGAMITGVAVLFFAAVMAICMWRQRAKTLSRRDTRFIADHDASSQTKEVCGKSAIFSPSKIP